MLNVIVDAQLAAMLEEMRLNEKKLRAEELEWKKLI